MFYRRVMLRKVVIGFCYLLCVFSVCAQHGPLFFNGDGTFRILQLTDLHLMPADTAACNATEEIVRSVAAAERPNLIAVTGDVVTGQPAQAGWQRVYRLFDSLGIPFVLTYGNHDGEYVSKPQTTAMMAASRHYAADAATDYALPVCDSTGKPQAVVYVFDSNDYPTDKNLGDYDWIHFDQVAQYRNTSRAFTNANGGAALPSVALFHIALPEHGRVLDDPSTIGNRLEGAGAPADINGGLFGSMVECGDVMGVFVGHDHENDYVGQHHNIALGFGRATGVGAYGSLPRGARVIELKQGQKAFDTYTVTPQGRDATYYYPSGLNSAEADTMTYLPAVKAKPYRRGVSYTYYEGLMKAVAQIDTCRLAGRGEMPNFDISQAPAQDHFAYRFKCLIKIPERGVYKFHTRSDDGSVLRIDGVTVVDNDGGHSARLRDGKIALEAGWHRLELDYFENYMGQELEAGVTSRTLSTRPIPSEWLYTERRK